MGRRNRQQRRTAAQAAADRAADETVGRVGSMLKDARRAGGWTIEQAAGRAGIATSTWSRLEVGADGRTTFATMNRAASAVGRPLHAYLERASAADQPRDIVHLRNQELVIRTASGGEWRPLPEQLIDFDARTSRAADALLCRARDYALVEIWDWFADVGSAARDWPRRLDAVERYAIARMRDDTLPRVSGVWIVRATRRNRELLRGHEHFFRALLPGSSVGWLRALGDQHATMPQQPGLLWVSVRGERLYPVRW